MKFAMIFFWYTHRRLLKSRGYSLSKLNEITERFWGGLLQNAQGVIESQKTAAAETGYCFSRQQIRIRW